MPKNVPKHDRKPPRWTICHPQLPQSVKIYDFETLQEKWKHDFQTHFNVKSMRKNEPKLVSSTSKKSFLRPPKKICHVSNFSKWNQKDPPKPSWTLKQIQGSTGHQKSKNFTFESYQIHIKILTKTLTIFLTQNLILLSFLMSLSTDFDLWII